MRFMVLVKASKESEAGVLPDEKLLAAMGKFNEKLVKAKMLIAGEGLQPSSRGTRITFSRGRALVTEGPFPETSELIAGFWMIRAKSQEEALAWMKRAPMQEDAELEIRPVFEAEDFAASDPTGKLRKQEEALRATVAAHH